MKFLQNISAIALLTVSVYANAQVDSIKTSDIEIVKEYTPFVEDGKKQPFQPVMPTIEPSEKENLRYNMPSAFIETQYQPDDLQPLPYTGQNTRFVRSAYIKAGYGTANNPLVKFAINALENHNYTIGARGGFQAVKGDLIEQKMHDGQLEVFGTKEITNATLNASVGYNRNALHLYGFDQTANEANNVQDIDKAFNVINATVGLESATTDEYAIKHQTQANFTLLNESLVELNETQIGLETKLSKRIIDGLDAQLTGYITTRTSKNDTHSFADYQKQNETLLNVTPSIKPALNGLSAELGASINNDKANGTKVFPHVKVELPLNNEQFTVFAGWTGRTIMNGYTEIQAVNPRISSEAFTQNYTKETRTPIGIRGSLSDNFSFSASVNQEVTKNAPLWANTTQPNFATFQNNSVFMTLYDEKLTSWRPNVAAHFQMGEMVNIVGDLSYHFYDTETYNEAYQLPELDAELGIQAKPIDKLLLSADITALTGTKYLLSTQESDQLDGVFNANIGAQYNINKKVAAFIDANNLANSDVEIWKNYPSVGVNILAGVVISLD